MMLKTTMLWVGMGLALVLANSAAAQRVSLGDLQNDIDALADDLCGVGVDPATCTAELSPSVRERLTEAEARAEEAVQALCQFAQDQGTPIEGLGCSADGELRLVNGTVPGEGRLEIQFDDAWGTVCDDGFGIEEANVACQQLGFESGVPIFTREFGQGSGQIWLDDVICNGTETRLDQCRNRGIGFHNCSHFEDVGVRCTAPALQVGDARIVDGATPNEGRLEVLIEADNWGTVCDDQFDNVDAGVACRELGYSDGVFTRLGQTSIPQGQGSIALDDVACVGTEARVSECPNRGLGIHNCSHFEDVVVTCN